MSKNAKNDQLNIICQMSNSWSMVEVHKKELDIRSLKHTEVNFEVTFEGHPNDIL